MIGPFSLRGFPARRMAAAALVVIALLAAGPAPRAFAAGEAAASWVCPPCSGGCDDAVFDKPGRCPVCGMDLVAKASLTSAAAAPAPPPPCTGPEYSGLDFWVGTWDAAWPAAGGNPAGTATNRIEKILGGCVISENFEAAGPSPLIGKSYSTFSPRQKKWRQTWVDNQSSYLDFDGDFSNPDGKIFAMDSVAPDGKPRKMRMVFKNITSDAFDWSWESSTDGGKTWQVQWPIHYTRKKAS